MKNVFLGLLLLVYNSTFSQSNFLINKFDVENISAENVNSISAEIDYAFKFAKESPFPDQHILDDHIYKD